MKIVQINSVYNSGSTGRIVEGIAEAARRRGHCTWIAYGRKSNPGPTETYRISGPVDHALHGLKSLTVDGHGLGSDASTKRLIRWLEDLAPDLISLHNVHGYYINVPVLFDYLRKRRKPVVWTLHDCWPITGHCAYFDRVDCEKWMNGCHHCPLTRSYPISLIDRSSRNWAMRREMFAGMQSLFLVSPSMWLQRIVGDSFLSSSPMRVIPNGIDLKAFHPTDETCGRITILGVANQWTDRKGLKDFYALRTYLPDSFRIVLVGLDRRQISDLPPGIMGLGKTQGVEELARHYSSAAVFVNPTHSDNFPTTNLEALACGTPVVTYDTGGSPESLNPAVGRVVRKGDIRALADAVLELITMDREQIRRDCREHAVKHFDREERFSDYVTLFEQLISKDRECQFGHASA